LSASKKLAVALDPSRGSLEGMLPNQFIENRATVPLVVLQDISHANSMMATIPMDPFGGSNFSSNLGEGSFLTVHFDCLRSIPASQEYSRWLRTIKMTPLPFNIWDPASVSVQGMQFLWSDSSRWSYAVFQAFSRIELKPLSTIVDGQLNYQPFCAYTITTYSKAIDMSRVGGMTVTATPLTDATLGKTIPVVEERAGKVSGKNGGKRAFEEMEDKPKVQGMGEGAKRVKIAKVNMRTRTKLF